jgi:hypothetical protein
LLLLTGPLAVTVNATVGEGEGAWGWLWLAQTAQTVGREEWARQANDAKTGNQPRFLAAKEKLDGSKASHGWPGGGDDGTMLADQSGGVSWCRGVREAMAMAMQMDLGTFQVVRIVGETPPLGELQVASSTPLMIGQPR